MRDCKSVEEVPSLELTDQDLMAATGGTLTLNFTKITYKYTELGGGAGADKGTTNPQR